VLHFIPFLELVSFVEASVVYYCCCT